MKAHLQYGGLEIEEDLRFQARDWRAQRVGWLVLLLGLLAALAGVFGSGPLERARAGGDDFEISYPRFARLEAPQILRFSLRPAPGADHA